ncbi:uncharacterized protein [Taeniopygia guttata]|uniref:uncharacterized protein n=1 Tax=Taeniopygia guttata TaxID=59729 RepID=UPI003BB941A1
MEPEGSRGAGEGRGTAASDPRKPQVAHHRGALHRFERTRRGRRGQFTGWELFRTLCDLCRRERQSGERCEKIAAQAVSSAGRSSRTALVVWALALPHSPAGLLPRGQAPISVRRCARGCERDLPNTRKTVCGVGNRCCSVFSEERRWQSVAEPFMDFVDRVRASVEKRVQNPELQDQLTLEIATTNANEACQRVILALPASPPPTLDQLIEECTRKATLMTEDSVISPRERVVASAAATPRTPGSAGPPP